MTGQLPRQSTEGLREWALWLLEEESTTGKQAGRGSLVNMFEIDHGRAQILSSEETRRLFSKLTTQEEQWQFHQIVDTGYELRSALRDAHIIALISIIDFTAALHESAERIPAALLRSGRARLQEYAAYKHVLQELSQWLMFDVTEDFAVWDARIDSAIAALKQEISKGGKKAPVYARGISRLTAKPEQAMIDAQRERFETYLPNWWKQLYTQKDDR